MSLKNVKGSLKRDEMKVITGGASCTSDCGASASGCDWCQTDRKSGGVVCTKNGVGTVTLCPISITPH